MSKPAITPSTRCHEVKVDGASQIEVPFPIFSWDDITVQLDGQDRHGWSGVETIKGFIQSGTIRFDEPVSGLLTIQSQMAPRRDFDFIEGAGLPVSALNLQLNMLTALAQEAMCRMEGISARADALGGRIDDLAKAKAARKICRPVRDLGPDELFDWAAVCDGFFFGFDEAQEFTQPVDLGSDVGLRVYDLNSLPDDEFYQGPCEIFTADPVIATMSDDCAFIYAAMQLPPDDFTRIK